MDGRDQSYLQIIERKWSHAMRWGADVHTPRISVSKKVHNAGTASRIEKYTRRIDEDYLTGNDKNERYVLSARSHMVVWERI